MKKEGPNEITGVNFHSYNYLYLGDVDLILWRNLRKMNQKYDIVECKK